MIKNSAKEAGMTGQVLLTENERLERISVILRKAEDAIKQGELDNALETIRTVYGYDTNNMFARTYEEIILAKIGKRDETMLKEKKIEEQLTKRKEEVDNTHIELNRKLSEYHRQWEEENKKREEKERLELEQEERARKAANEERQRQRKKELEALKTVHGDSNDQWELKMKSEMEAAIEGERSKYEQELMHNMGGREIPHQPLVVERAEPPVAHHTVNLMQTMLQKEQEAQIEIELRTQHEEEIKKLRIVHAKFHEEEIKKLRMVHAKFHEEEIKKIRMEHTKFHEEEIKKIHMEHAKFHEEEIRKLRIGYAKSNEEEIQKIRTKLTKSHEEEIQKLQMEQAKFPEEEIQKLRMEHAKFHEAAIEKLQSEHTNFQEERQRQFEQEKLSIIEQEGAKTKERVTEVYRTLVMLMDVSGENSHPEVMLMSLRSILGISEDEHANIVRSVRLNSYMDTLRTVWKKGTITNEEIKNLTHLCELYNISQTEHERLTKQVKQQLGLPDEQTRILVIDDNVDVLVFVEYVLKKTYTSIFTANSVRKAVDYMQKEMPSLILCDIMMPETGGFAFCDKIKRGDYGEEMKNVPFVFMSGCSDEYFKSIADQLGVQKYLVKPFSKELLKKTVSDVLLAAAS